ncbi:hypothetical protein [Mycobacterium deserti]|uniref:Polyketide synthase n=1 Tax=Mycobacterium deserti TaxID=2978347 RepID=A0ABT2MFQ3_9MYCO|nr:hypothetical protein [Mycobacterium deserti]MCT7659836.1 hypothetical protein [Mycobacterium deserti]
MVAPYLVSPVSEVLNPFGDFATATVSVVDYALTDAGPCAATACVSTPAASELTAELDGATQWLGVAADEILLAALARTIARTLGDGIVPVDIASAGRPMLDAVPVACAVAQQAGATEVLGSVHRVLAVATERAAHGPSEVYFNYIGAVADGPEPVQETPPAMGHALEVRVYRTGGLIHVDWWYDTNRFERYTIEELSEQFPLSLYEMTSDALPPA